MKDDLVEVQRYDRRVEAECAAALLRSCGIPAFVFREDMGGAMPEITGAIRAFTSRLMAPADRVDEAREILKAPPAATGGDAYR